MKTFTYEDQDRIWENLTNQQITEIENIISDAEDNCDDTNLGHGDIRYICTMNYIKAIFKKENEYGL